MTEEEFLKVLVEAEKKTWIYDNDNEFNDEEENEIMSKIIESNINVEKASELMNEIESYKNVIHDAQDAMSSAETELQTMLNDAE